MTPIVSPLAHLSQWTDFFRAADIPVLASTADALEAMRQNEDDLDAHSIAELLSGDPLMTLKVLVWAAANRPQRVLTDAESLTSALVMMGISPFFRAFGPQTVVETVLGQQPEALEGLGEVLRRAHRSADFALGFAVHRMHPDAAVIYVAALLHDFAEMLLWCHAPLLACRIRRELRERAGLRSAVVQRAVLGVELADLQQALMRTWRLPELLVRISDDKHARDANVLNVLLAVRLARHTASGWDNPAIPDDVRDIARLLNIKESAALDLARQIDG